MVTLNEERAIAKVISDIKIVAPDAEILVVDSSSDKTAEIAESLGARIVKQLPPRGYGPALDAALSGASGQIVITIDCDDTYPTESIAALVSKLNEGFDLVSASRLGHRPAAMPFKNYLANRLFAALAWLLCGVRTTDVHTGMRAYRRELLEAFPYDPNGMALPVELLVGPVQAGYRHAEIFIDYRPRIGESTLKPWPGTVWTLRRLWKWRRFMR
jgi:glycosyltransferase involved in cell wall biosynthesis